MKKAKEETEENLIFSDNYENKNKIILEKSTIKIKEKINTESDANFLDRFNKFINDENNSIFSKNSSNRFFRNRIGDHLYNNKNKKNP